MFAEDRHRLRKALADLKSETQNPRQEPSTASSMTRTQHVIA